MRYIALVLLLAVMSCRGEIVVPGKADAGDAGMTARPDAATADVVEVDLALPDPACVGVTCATNAECGRGICWCSPGFMGDPNVGCTPGNPCDGVSCSYGGTCDDLGECPCDPGFTESMIGGCTAEVDEFPLQRTEEAVCARWLADYPEQAGPRWQVQPATECDLGELDPAYQLDEIRRVSLYRWLSALPPVTTLASYVELVQACATTLNAENRGATHEVLPEFECYSAEAVDGARESSIVRGVATPAASVDRYIEDDGVPGLGNRRWILNPEMGATAFGQRGSYSCMYAIDLSGSSNPQFVAYPYGVFPAQGLRGRWMWSSSQLVFNDTTTVTVTDAAGANVAVTDLTQLDGNIVPAALTWNVADATVPNEYTVTLQGLAGVATEVTYPVTLVNCQ
jgi:hypothetical protein